MLDQFGTITVRECRLTRREVEQIVAENLEQRGPRSYEFDYAHPVLIWGRDGSLIVRWPSSVMRDEPGRTPRPMDLLPWPEFVKRETARLESEKAQVASPAKPATGA